MPTFDFQCRDCSTTFEFARPFGSKKNPACPSCGSKKILKLLTPPAIQFKGKGFYKTDSAPAPKKKPVTETPNTGKKEETAPKTDTTTTTPKAAEPSKPQP